MHQSDAFDVQGVGKGAGLQVHTPCMVRLHVPTLALLLMFCRWSAEFKQPPQKKAARKSLGNFLRRGLVGVTCAVSLSLAPPAAWLNSGWSLTGGDFSLPLRGTMPRPFYGWHSPLVFLFYLFRCCLFLGRHRLGCLSP